MTTTIIQLDSSPSQHRKHYNTFSPNKRSQYYIKSPDLTSTGNSSLAWDSTDNAPYERYSQSLSSKHSFPPFVSSDLLSPLKNNDKNYLMGDFKKKFNDYGTVEQAISTSAINNIEEDNYHNLSNFISQSESSSLHNISATLKSNRSRDKYGFFLEDSEEDYETPSVQQLKEVKSKEKKWLQMLNNWHYYINFKWDKIRDRCRKGIPHSLRSKAWFHLCGAHIQKNFHPNLYYELINKDIPDEVRNVISQDLHRQFPNHEMFASENSNGQKDLFEVLKAFAAYRPKLSYCQSQAPIAAVLLMHMPAERAFWCLVALSKYYIRGYFMPNLEELPIHGQMLFAFIKKYCSSAYNLLNRQNIDPLLYMTEWFMCIYSRNLPWPSVLRVWDMFLCEGLPVLFKVGLFMVEVALTNENLKTCPTINETYQKLRNIPKHLLAEDTLVKGIRRYDLKDIDLLKEHKVQLKKFEKAKKKKSKQRAK